MADNQFNPLADVMQGFQLGAAVDQAKFQSQNHQLELQKAQQELQAKQAQQQLADVVWKNNDRNMLGKLYGVNPALGKDLELSLDNRDLEKAKGLQYIETLPIDERNDAYKVWRETTKSDDAPDEYNKQFVNFQINNAKDLKREYEKLEVFNPKTGKNEVKLLEKHSGQTSDTPYGVYNKPSTVVNIDQRQEGAYSGAVGKGEGESVVKKLDEIRNAGDQAIATKDFLQTQREALSKVPSTGPLSGVQSFLGNLVGQLNIADDKERDSLSKLVSNASNLDKITAAARKISIPLAKQLGMNPTDADFRAILATVADVAKGKKTNEDLIEMWDRLSDKAIAKAQLADDITQNNRHKTAFRELRDFDINYNKQREEEIAKEREKSKQSAPLPISLPNQQTSIVSGKVGDIGWRFKP